MGVKAFVCVLALALAACGSTATQANTAQLVAAPLPRMASGWTELTPQPIEVDGRIIAPTCSDAPGTEAAYRFWAKRGTGDGLVVFFDGGGACWDDVTCAVPRRAANPQGDGFYKAELMPDDNPARMGGIFDLDNPRNPLRDWSFVVIPYCTGDVHSGANTVNYTDPDTGEHYTIQHRGADNFRVVLEWMRANFDVPARLLVTGSSAGAYGAATHYARIREVFPGGQGMMLGDAGQGVTTPGFLDRRNHNWRYQLPASVFGANAQLTHDEDVIARLAQHYPQDRFAQYTTAHDITQTAFYALMGAENACIAWTQTMAQALQTRERQPNFRAYLASGDTHTILRSRLFYSERSGGQPFAEWLASMVDSGDWENRTCTECLAPPPPRSCRF